MAMPPFVLSDRDILEETCRRATQTVQLAPGELMCRVLGKYLVFVDPHDLGVTPRLCLDGFWESWITTAIARAVRPGLFCVDVGANHGYFTLLLADAVGPDGRVLAIEPNPLLVKLLEQTIEVNGFRRHTCVIAKAANDGSVREVSLAVPRRRGACASICGDALGEARTSALGEIPCDVVRVGASSIDDLTASWPRVDVVKIDAEGAEPLIWQGMSRTIRLNPHLLAIVEFVPSRYVDAPGFLDEIQSADFPLRIVAHDSTIQPISIADALTERDGEGCTLFLQRETD
jgi:FkbM family methyltransferase